MRGIKWLIIILVLSSCTLGPDYHRPDFFDDADLAFSSGLQIQSKAKISKEWYKTFDDDTLNKLISQGLASGPSLKIATHKLHAARYQLKSTQVQYFPMINANSGYYYDKNSKNFNRGANVDYFQAGFDASWELDIWGAGHRANEAAEAMYQAIGANLDYVKLVLVSEIASNYIGLRTIQEQIRITNENLHMQQEIASIVRHKYNVGLADDIAFNQAEYAVATTQSQLPALQQEEESYKNSIAELLGVLPEILQDDLQPKQPNLIHRRFSYKLEPLYQLPISVIRERPDVKIAEEQLKAQNAQVGVSLIKMFPSFSISGLIGYQAKEIPHLFTPAAYTYTFNPSITTPLLHWGELLNNYKQQKEITHEYYYQYQQAILSALSDVRNAFAALKDEQAKNQAYKKAVENQQRIISNSLQKYRNGLLEFSDILTAEQNLLLSQQNLAISNGMMYQNLIVFYKSVGGGLHSKFDACQNASCEKGTSCNILCGL